MGAHQTKHKAVEMSKITAELSHNVFSMDAQTRQAIEASLALAQDKEAKDGLVSQALPILSIMVLINPVEHDFARGR
jgi:hypothetical protein